MAEDELDLLTNKRPYIICLLVSKRGGCLMSDHSVRPDKKESIVRGILHEEFDRSQQMETLYLKELQSLPKGSLQVKVIRGRKYHYRCFRDGGKVKSVFVPKDKVGKISEDIRMRREIESSLKRLRQDRALVRKVLK